MRAWQVASAAFFLYVAAVSLWQGLSRPGRSREVARQALAGAACGLAVLLLSLAFDRPVLSQWIWPPLLLLIGYWASGRLFVAPRPSHEAALAWLDDRLDVQTIARRTPRAVAEILEAAYAVVYLLVPLALLIRVASFPSPAPDAFWTVVLVTDYICFGVLPWVQTRPPRALEPGDPWASTIRRFNLRVLGATSIQVNTFPSGHAGEALAAALLVIGAHPLAVVLMFLGAVGVSAGAVLGRYHYLIDALVGWAVALAVFLVVMALA
jgi:membrane-associated phospholipid phosphatase